MITHKDVQSFAKKLEDEPLRRASLLYEDYLNDLAQNSKTDFSHMQLSALKVLKSCKNIDSAFEHIIVDEYQDTNSVQEALYFELAKSSKNLCVVGDDDQALYRFRGATVENFVQFKRRVKAGIGAKDVKSIPLDINYRSPTPLRLLLRYSAQVERIDGRKIFVKGELRVDADDRLCAEANGLFVAVDAARFVNL
jgi:DNA helicase-2/ATP-dependent DNA helicase PcrA